MGKARGGFWGTALHCIPAVALLLSGCAAGPGVVDFSPDRTTGPAPLAVAFTSAVSGAASAYA
jgi:PKD repeat protein